MKGRSFFISVLAIIAIFTAAGSSSSDEITEHKMLVLLTEFSDVKFSSDTSSIDSLLNLSLKYFSNAFPDSDKFTCTASPIISLPKPVAYYGANTPTGKDVRPGVLVWQACKEAEKYIDFSEFDSDDDGTVDYVIIISAGGNESEDGIANHIWPHKWDIYSANKESGDYDKLSLKVDGKYISDYSITSELKHDANHYELCGIGSICHEMAHTLGLVDMYDTDYEQSGGLSNGLWGSISLMDRGNFNDDGNTPPPFCAIELFQTGIGLADTLSEGKFTLTPVETTRNYIVVPSECDGEFYLIECRKGKGLLFYHIDMSDHPAGFSTSRNEVISASQRWRNFNEVNCRPDFQCAEIIPASDSATGIEDLYWASGNGPELKFRHSGKPKLFIKNIKIQSNGSVSFNCIGPEITEMKADCFQNAAILTWKSTYNGACSLFCGQDTVALNVKPYSNGEYAYVMTKLTPKTQYSIRIVEENGRTAKITFTTKAFYPNSLPFIYLNDTPRNPNGTFKKGTLVPLMVNGAPYADEVIWYFDVNRIHAGHNGYYSVPYSGLLKAEIHNADGSVDVITKEMIVK